MKFKINIAPVLAITREEIFEDELADSEFLKRFAKKRLIPQVQFNVDLVEAVDPQQIFLRVEKEYKNLGFRICRLGTFKEESFARAEIQVDSVNKKTKDVDMSKLVVVFVEGTFVSVTSFPLS